tara:strand:- start:14015 stop:14578 length:564 start_codon:yes stop_codon:yes gene_type:complete
MANPSQMFDHTLDAVKGWFHEAALDNSAKLSSNVTIDPFEAGRVVHLNSSGEYETGISGTSMAIFLLNSSDDPDVANPGGDYWQAIAPTGKLSGLVATGAYELESSEFDSSGTYNPGNLLCADVANTTAASGGILDSRDDSDAALTVPWASGGTDQAICGVVSGGKVENSHGVDVVRFWPVYLPGES